jgi:hypothetical protein
MKAPPIRASSREWWRGNSRDDVVGFPPAPIARSLTSRHGPTTEPKFQVGERVFHAEPLAM